MGITKPDAYAIHDAEGAPLASEGLAALFGEDAPRWSESQWSERGLALGGERVVVAPRSGDSVEVTTTELRGPDGAGRGKLSLFRVTREVSPPSAEPALTRLIDALPIGVLIRHERELRHVNPSFARTAGASDPRELLGRDIFALIHPDDREATMALFSRPSSAHEGTELRILRRDGKTAIVALSSGVRLQFEGQPCHLRIAVDVSEQRRLESQLVVSDRMAGIGLLAAGIAHEINNPLAAALANVDLALESEDQEDVAARLRRVREALDRARVIVRDLKLFSRLEEEIVEDVDVHRVIDSAARVARLEIEGRAKLVKDYGAVPKVLGSESRLGQVFLNLLVNAAQAIPPGAASTNEIRIRTAVEPSGRIVIDVTDTGAGMSRDTLAHIFTSFFTTKPAGEGTGLGLPISQRLVTAMGGDIQVESEVGRGTRFRVSLRAGSGKPSAPRVPAVTGPSAQRARVLVIDDDRQILEAIQRGLDDEHDVIAFASAADALVHLRSAEPYDVVLCDMMMAGMSGVDFHAAVSAELPALASRIVFLTGGAYTQRAREFLDRTPNAKLEKPFGLAALRDFIRARVAVRGA